MANSSRYSYEEVLQSAQVRKIVQLTHTTIEKSINDTTHMVCSIIFLDPQNYQIIKDKSSYKLGARGPGYMWLFIFKKKIDELGLPTL
jgi:hypothetical protein